MLERNANYIIEWEEIVLKSFRAKIYVKNEDESKIDLDFIENNFLNFDLQDLEEIDTPEIESIEIKKLNPLIKSKDS